jgi:hypothetical protein
MKNLTQIHVTMPNRSTIQALHKNPMQPKKKIFMKNLKICITHPFFSFLNPF